MSDMNDTTEDNEKPEKSKKEIGDEILDSFRHVLFNTTYDYFLCEWAMNIETRDYIVESLSYCDLPWPVYKLRKLYGILVVIDPELGRGIVELRKGQGHEAITFQVEIV